MPNDFIKQGVRPSGRAVEPPPPGSKSGPVKQGATKPTGYEAQPGRTQPKARNNGVPKGPFCLDPKGI